MNTQNNLSDQGGNSTDYFLEGENRETAQIQLADQELRVVIAKDKTHKVNGLSGLSEVPLDGMLFVIEPKAQPKFWMLDMKIPIDIVWIADGKIIKIDQNVPTEPGKSKAELTTYSPPEPVDTVVELSAGRSSELSLKAGDPFKANGAI